MQSEYLYCRSSNNDENFIDFISGLGGDPIQLLEEIYGLKNHKQEKLNFVPWSSIIHLYEGTAKNLNEPYFGMKWALAQPTDLRNVGPQVLFLSISQNMTHFLDLVINFQTLHTNAILFDYRVDEQKGELIGRTDFHPMAEYSRQFSEHVMAIIALFGKRFIPDFKPKYVQFQHSAPEDMTIYNDIFECPIEFNCDANIFVTDSTILNPKKNKFAKRIIKPLVKTFVNWRINENIKHETTVAMTVAELLPAILGVRKSDIGTISAAMSMSEKKLQRLLHHEGTSFSAVLDDVRKNLARRMLLDSEISPIRIAHLLDYSSDKALITAFKRWYGITPGKYRRENQHR